MEISEGHPRYRSLMARERIVCMVDEGMVTPTGMISHGRGEAYDYLLGEATIVPAEQAERVAAAYLLEAINPVICVNGNAAALAGEELAALARLVPAKLEVNLFHRTPERMTKVVAHMESFGIEVLGLEPDASIPGIASDRALCTMEGIHDADVVLVPIEDGDRAEALVQAGKVVIAIDLNPLSRTSRAATVPVVDEVTRAVPNIGRHVKAMRGDSGLRRRTIKSFDAEDCIDAVLVNICDHLMGDRGD